jgi:hypothetical protein
MYRVKQISLTAKIVLGLVALGGVVLYLVVLDLGVNAGLIHSGVRVGHLDVGRLTDTEAQRLISDVGKEMQETPIVFTADGLPLYSWSPDELGWQPRPQKMVERAMNVGRRGDFGASLSDRIKAWFGGVKIRWERPKPWRVRREVNAVAAEAALLEMDVNKARLKFLIRKATWAWPREPFYEIPLKP